MSVYDILKSDNHSKALKEALNAEIKKLYQSTFGKIFPSIFGNLPLAIFKEVIKDENFWNQHLFVGLSNYLKSEKEAINKILDLFDKSIGSEWINSIFRNRTEIWIQNLLAGTISSEDKEDFFSAPISFIRTWLNSPEANTIQGLGREDTQKRLGTIALVLVGLILLGLVAILVNNRNRNSKINVGMTTRILVENIFNNTKADKNISKLWSACVNLLKSFIYQTDDADIYKNLYIAFRELSKTIKLLQDDKAAFRKELENFPKSYTDNALKILKTIVDKGGLWEGTMMDYIIADLIFARVDVTYEGTKPKFSRRLNHNIIDWTDEESRKKHPLSKTLRAHSSFSNEELVKDAYYQTLSPILDKIKAPELNSSSRTLNKLGRNLFTRGVADAKKEILKEFGAKALSEKESKELELYKKQIKSITEDFTFAHFYEIFKVDYVCSGSNIVSGTPVYFNHTLTPNMPIVKAVRISSNFPGLFRPIELKHKEDEVDPQINFPTGKEASVWVNNSKAYYQKNYHGWFIDGGALNNFPINAFNKDNSKDFQFRDPKSKLELNPNDKVFAFKLGGIEIEVPTRLTSLLKPKDQKETIDTFKKVNKMDKGKSKFDRSQFKFIYPDEEIIESFNANSGSSKLMNLISGLYGSALSNSMDGRSSAFYDKNEQIIRLWTGRVDLFDLITREQEIDIVDKFGYNEIYKHFNIGIPNDWENALEIRLKRNTKRGLKQSPWLKRTERLKKR